MKPYIPSDRLGKRAQITLVMRSWIALNEKRTEGGLVSNAAITALAVEAVEMAAKNYYLLNGFKITHEQITALITDALYATNLSEGLCFALVTVSSRHGIALEAIGGRGLLTAIANKLDEFGERTGESIPKYTIPSIH